VEKITHQNLRLGNCFEAPYTGPMDSLEENFTARDKNSLQNSIRLGQIITKCRIEKNEITKGT